MNTKIWVTGKYPGFHCWKGAPDGLVFLRDWHRHLFHIKTTVEVDHPDRAIEFFSLQSCVGESIKVLFSFQEKGYLFEERSCEQIAIDLLTFLRDIVKINVIEVEVSEDGENGATVTWD